MGKVWIFGQLGSCITVKKRARTNTYGTTLVRIITYVLLCGYSPFRSEDVKVLMKETTDAKVQFHERYWKNVSPQG
jgi:hypothetical protein